ncbi:hypothetical protein LY76DRAFT_251134 [Colletotrichum caudatum]|nr:hypothetical protein LY76DRAFT_251134 [Colletotrichum caudatum]
MESFASPMTAIQWWVWQGSLSDWFGLLARTWVLSTCLSSLTSVPHAVVCVNSYVVRIRYCHGASSLVVLRRSFVRRARRSFAKAEIRANQSQPNDSVRAAAHPIVFCNTGAIFNPPRPVASSQATQDDCGSMPTPLEAQIKPERLKLLRCRVSDADAPSHREKQGAWLDAPRKLSGG